MAGLLNGGGFDDPLTMGLLGASQALMTPMAQGGGMGAAFNAFPAAQQQAMRQQYMRQQMESQQSEAELRRAQLMAAQEKARRETALEAGRQSLYGEIGMQPLTQEIAARAAALGIKPSELAEITNAGRAKVARTVEVMGPGNMPQTRREDEFGNQIGTDVGKPFEMKLADLGGSLSPYNPFAPPSSFTKTMAPGEVERNQLTMRGQNMVDARSREAAAATLASGNAGRAPAGYRFKPDGALEFIPGGPADPMSKADKAPTEAQTKDNLFATRADAANKIVVGLGDVPNVSAVNIKQGLADFPIIGGSLGTGANALLSDQSQQYEQAKRDFINAVLRKESGAVIGKDEFASADLQYFPQPFDSAAVKKQKTENRQRAIEGIALGAGPLGRPAKDDPLGLRR